MAQPAVVDSVGGILDDGVLGDLPEGSARIGNQLHWAGPLEAGQSVEITYVLTVGNDGDGVATNVAFVGNPTDLVPSEPGDPDTPPAFPDNPTTDVPGDSDNPCEVPDCSSTTTEIDLYTDFDVAKSVVITRAGETVEAPALPGDVLTYVVTATNSGNTDFAVSNPAYVVDSLADVLDDGELTGEPVASPDLGVVGMVGDQVQWAGPLGTGDNVTITYTVTVGNDGDGKATNVAFAGDPTVVVPGEPGNPDNPDDPGTPPTLPDEPTTDIPDPDDPNNPCEEPDCATTTTDVDLHTELSVSKSVEIVRDGVVVEGPAVPGDILTYSVTASNIGTSDFTETEPRTSSSLAIRRTYPRASPVTIQTIRTASLYLERRRRIHSRFRRNPPRWFRTWMGARRQTVQRRRPTWRLQRSRHLNPRKSRLTSPQLIRPRIQQMSPRSIPRPIRRHRRTRLRTQRRLTQSSPDLVYPMPGQQLCRWRY